MQDPNDATSQAPHDAIDASSASLARADASIARMRALLDRPLTPEDLRANTALVAAKVEADSGALRSMLVFRVGAERLALDATSAHRVVPRSGVRRIPHRTNEVFAGVASVGGELTLIARIDAALGIAAATSGTLARPAVVANAPAAELGEGAGTAGRFVVIGDATTRWAFAVDLVEGVCRVPESSLLPPPATVRHASDGCTAHLVPIACDFLGPRSGEHAAPGDAAPLVSLLDARRLTTLFARSLA